MSKIEKPSALRELEQIIDQSDGIMIARGDLGVELPVEQVPGLQKAITRAARDAGKPVVVATQMLESMINSPVPTRAEVSDVATAVFEGADAVMLSAESAAGEYPVEAVRTLDKVAVEVERDPLYDSIIHTKRAAPDGEAASALTAAACSVAHDMGLACIVCYTSTGATALRAARQRPRTPILVLTPKTETARRLAVVWGLHCVHTKDPKTTAEMVERSGRHRPGSQVRDGVGEDDHRRRIALWHAGRHEHAAHRLHWARRGHESDLFRLRGDGPSMAWNFTLSH